MLGLTLLSSGALANQQHAYWHEKLNNNNYLISGRSTQQITGIYFKIWITKEGVDVI